MTNNLMALKAWNFEVPLVYSLRSSKIICSLHVPGQRKINLQNAKSETTLTASSSRVPCEALAERLLLL